MSNDEHTLAPTSQEALAKTCPGETTLLAFSLPEDLGRSYADHAWTVDARTQIILGIIRNEDGTSKPKDILAASQYLDTLATKALILAGLVGQRTVSREMVREDVRYKEDITVMNMVTRGEPDDKI